MSNLIKRASALAFLTATALSLSACGGKVEQVLKDANLTLSQQNGDEVVSLLTELDTQNLVVSAATLQVDKGLGTVEILNDLNTQKTYLKLSFNVGQALKLPTPVYSSTLPNGTTLPLTGIDLTKVMAFDVGSNGSKVYLYYDMQAKKALLGAALNVDSLKIDTPATVLSSFNFSGVTGLAGLYFGDKAHTSGLGVFVDLSSAFSAARTIGFVPMSLTKEQQSKVDRKLFELGVSNKPIVIK